MAEKQSILPKLKIFEKLKKIKHIEIYAIIFVGIMVLVIWFYPFEQESGNMTTTDANTTQEYAEELENKLSTLLCNIKGAGNVNVMVTLDGEVELVLAYSSDKKNNSTTNSSSNGTVSKTESITTSTEPILINQGGSNEPLVLYKILPKVKGVVVVATGAGDIKVKLDILKAVQALLKVESGQVEIFVKGS